MLASVPRYLSKHYTLIISACRGKPSITRTSTSTFFGISCYRWAVASRLCAAGFGGYLLAYASTALLTVSLPMERVNRVITASLVSFAVWCAAAIWAFAARHTWRSWWPLLLGSALMLTGAWVCRGSGLRP